MAYTIIFLLVCLSLRISSGIPLKKPESSFTNLYENQVKRADLTVDVFDGETPLLFRQALANATLSDVPEMNQYSPIRGQKRLANAIANMYSKLINRELDPDDNIVCTVGAIGALNAAFISLTKPRDEWIVIEPLWSKYVPIIKMAGGVPRFTSLKMTKTSDPFHGNDCTLDKKEFESLFNAKTKGILLNNPHNPTGKIFNRDELEFIADMAKKYNVYVIADEVHEWIIYDKNTYIRFASLPGMFERTISIGSASKSFNVAGWRIGWAYGPKHLMEGVGYVHEYSVNNAPTPQQEAMGFILEEEWKNFNKPESYIASNLRNVTFKRDMLVKALNEAGMVPIIPDGGNCMVVGWPRLANSIKHLSRVDGRDTGKKFANWISTNVGLSGFSLSQFYNDVRRYQGDTLIRVCFQKDIETLSRAVENLQRLNNAL